MWLKTLRRTYSSVWHLGMGGGLVILCCIERKVRLICGNRACYNKPRAAPCGGMPHLDAGAEIVTICRIDPNLCRTSFPSVATFVSSLTVLSPFLIYLLQITISQESSCCCLFVVHIQDRQDQYEFEMREIGVCFQAYRKLLAARIYHRSISSLLNKLCFHAPWSSWQMQMRDTVQRRQMINKGRCKGYKVQGIAISLWYASAEPKYM